LIPLLRYIAGVVIVLIGLAASAQADGRRVALVIGNSAYRNVPALPNPANDAAAVAASFKRLGFAVTLVSNGSFDDMRRGLLAFGQDAASADMAAVYFAGHGMEVGGENWLIPVDATLKRETAAENEAISLRSVMMQVSNTTSLGLVILDACRNNPFIAKMQRTLASRALSGGLGRIEPVGNVLVAYAARDGTTALDGDGRNSPFTAALLHNIETPGVEVTFMFRNVRDDGMEATKNEQQPFVYGSLSRKAIYLAGQPPAKDEKLTQRANLAPVTQVTPTTPTAPAPPSLIDPALIGSWELMVPSARGPARWVWNILPTGTYNFHSEGGRPAPAHEGTMTAANGHWTLHVVKGMRNWDDGGDYDVHDTTAAITGKLGTGSWKRAQ
jgi:hypothetical protein